MAKDFDLMEDSNRSSNPSIHDISDPARRRLIAGGLGLGLAGAFAPLAGCITAPPAPLLGFRGIAPNRDNKVTVPPGYVTQVIAAWGDPIGLPGRMPAFRDDASNSAADQEAQMGMHHDGMHFYPHASGPGGLLVMNHEYTDERLLHADGRNNWSAEKVRKSQASHGVSVIEVRPEGGRWAVVRPSPYARRITATTPMAFGGPAAGHPMVRTAADPAGMRPVGTYGNCASGITPWGTYLTCEENFIGYFNGPPQLTAHEARWGLKPGDQWGLRWFEHDERFDATRHPNEPNRFGWAVEIDPFDPTSTPVKRTALGRAAREGATVAVTRGGRAAVYMGEDAQFEYIYKFVSRDSIRPGGARANAQLLDHGTLYVARFDADGRGEWLALVHGQGPLTPANGFADQGEVVIKARQASDLLGGTRMDRPEWTAVDKDGWVYCSLTNNSARGAQGRPGVDAANPRANNVMGQIIRWKEDGDFDGTRMSWNHFVLAGDPANERPEAKGNVRGDAFAGPDGLWVDARGVLWIQQDMGGAANQGEFARLGNNGMLAADPRTGEIRRFLVGPTGCEITGATMTPDGRTMFVNIQHPGNGSAGAAWPDFRPGGRPRSATVVIRKEDGGLVGT